MITLDPEMIGNLAPPSKLTETTFDGKPSVAVPYARLPRIERLRANGKIDVTEEPGSADEGERADGAKESREEREKRKMRGKGKSLKRYLRKQRKNVIDPAAVSFPLCFSISVLQQNLPYPGSMPNLDLCLRRLQLTR